MTVMTVIMRQDGEVATIEDVMTTTMKIAGDGRKQEEDNDAIAKTKQWQRRL